MKNRKKIKGLLLVIGVFLISASWIASLELDDTWANWEKRFERAFEGITPPYLPGQVMGILVPNEPRQDLLPMAAFGYEALSAEQFETVIIFMPPPEGYSLDGMVIPDLPEINTSIGRFRVDQVIGRELARLDIGVFVDNIPFSSTIPRTLEAQLAALKFALKSRSLTLKILPVFVSFSDMNSQVKDYAPLVAEMLKDLGLSNDVVFVMTADLTQTPSISKLISFDSRWLNAIRNMDIDSAVSIENEMHLESEVVQSPHRDPLAMGLLTLKWLGADHGTILSYCHSGQLILTKDKSNTLSFVTAGFSTGMRPAPKMPHFDQGKLKEIFDAGFRTDILQMVRQTVASILNPTAAAPPTLPQKQAGKKWPAYVTLYDSAGNLAGQEGSHVAIGPLQESLRQFAYKSAKDAQPELNEKNFPTYTIDISIPYGFSRVTRPEDLVPLLNGVIVHRESKTAALHPDAWRKYPDPHQLLSVICYDLGMKPWAYATKQAKMESFRVLSFNEKEPFQDLSPKKQKNEDAQDEQNFEDVGGGGLIPF